ncbi:MAG: XdhC family protein [Mangrovicoccus sp.]|nr:XdhC family protein [Mangrovicoccus sp.]
MTILNTFHNAAHDPIQAVLASPEGAVLALIAGVEGPSYRPVGAAMAVLGNGQRVGSLSSGCIEADIATHAAAARAEAQPKLLRYGRGSPFMDIHLPCGGGLDIVLLPRPDLDVLRALLEHRAARQPCVLEVNLRSGRMGLSATAEERTERQGDLLRIYNAPELRFLVFGKGPEASTFAALVQSANYPNLLLSPDQETLDHGAAAGCATQHLRGPVYPEGLGADARSAVVLFFHDHDWEPPILQGALQSPAFYIGAQGSLRARETRMVTMRALGLPEDQLARLHGPVGLIRSARDPGTLAVSVLAEILDKAMIH